MSTGNPSHSATTPLGGCIPIVCTPFLPDGSLDLESLRRVVDWLIGEGASGLSCLAIASEGYKLTEPERDTVLETVVDAANGRRPVIASVEGQSGAVAADRARRAAARGASAVMAMPPFFVKADLAGLISYYRAIGEAGLPILLQDVPQLTGVSTGPAIWQALAEAVPALVGIKVEGMPQGSAISAARAVAGGQWRVFCGWGGLSYADALERGAHGVMPAPNFTRLFADVFSQWETGGYDAAMLRLAAELPFVLWSMQSIDHSVAAAKAELVRLGIIAAAAQRAPALALDDIARFQLQHFLIARHG